MKRQYFLNRLSNAIVQLKGDSGLRFLLPPFEFQPELDEKQFIEDHSYMGWRARRLQIGKAFTRIGPVHLPQSFARRHQTQMLAHRGGDWIAKIGIQILKRPSDNAAEPARRKLALASRFVDGNNASDLERGGRFLFSVVGPAFFINVA